MQLIRGSFLNLQIIKETVKNPTYRWKEDDMGKYIYPSLFWSSLSVTSLLQKIYISTCFLTNWKKSKENFCFYKIKVKKITLAFVLLATVLEASPTPRVVKHLPGNHTQQLRIKAPIASNCVCEHLCFILIYLVCPLARRDLR